MIKRSESVALINKALERGHWKGSRYSDVDEKYWAFKDIIEVRPTTYIVSIQMN